MWNEYRTGERIGFEYESDGAVGTIVQRGSMRFEVECHDGAGGHLRARLSLLRDAKRVVEAWMKARGH